MGSRRLPGKSMMPVWDEMPLIELVLRRVAAARQPDDVVLVTGESERDDPLAAVAVRLGLGVHRGSEDDVLERFDGALRRYPGDGVIRICADNPFVDPSAIDDLVAFWTRSAPCDYASNHTERSGLPDGSGAEILSAGALRRAAAQATSDLDREHVPAYILGHPDVFACVYAPAPEPALPRLRLDIDTPEDYAAMRALALALPADGAPLWDIPTVVAAREAVFA